MATQWTAGLTSGATLSANTLNTIGAAWETYTPVITASVTNPNLGSTGSAQVSMPVLIKLLLVKRHLRLTVVG